MHVCITNHTNLIQMYFFKFLTLIKSLMTVLILQHGIRCWNSFFVVVFFKLKYNSSQIKRSVLIISFFLSLRFSSVECKAVCPSNMVFFCNKQRYHHKTVFFSKPEILLSWRLKQKIVKNIQQSKTSLPYWKTNKDDHCHSDHHNTIHFLYFDLKITRNTKRKPRHTK